MAERDVSGLPDGRELVGSMEWDSLPYGCVGIARRNEVSGKSVWSWLILVPWAVNDAKPWIDGTELIDKPLMSEADQRAQVQAKMRTILDARYGESVGAQSVEDFLRRLQSEE